MPRALVEKSPALTSVFLVAVMKRPSPALMDDSAHRRPMAVQAGAVDRRNKIGFDQMPTDLCRWSSAA